LALRNPFHLQDNGAAFGDLDLTSAGRTLTFIGRGAGTVIDAHQVDRVFQVFAGVRVIFRDLRITGGLAPDDGTAGAVPSRTDVLGGGILNQNGFVTLDRVVVRGNTAQGTMGHNALGGGIYSTGSLVLGRHSAVTSNQATGAGAFFSGIGTPGSA